MVMFPVNTHRHDPYKNFKFRVKLEGRYIPGVSQISALTRTTEVVTHRDGSDPSNFRFSPGTTQYASIVMERGITHDTTFEDWANAVFTLGSDADMSLKNFKKDIVIELLNLQGTVVMAYRVYRCWVTKYQALPELDANGQCVAVETIVIQHEGWERDRQVVEPQET